VSRHDGPALAASTRLTQSAIRFHLTLVWSTNLHSDCSDQEGARRFYVVCVNGVR